MDGFLSFMKLIFELEMQFYKIKNLNTKRDNNKRISQKSLVLKITPNPEIIIEQIKIFQDKVQKKRNTVFKS